MVGSETRENTLSQFAVLRTISGKELNVALVLELRAASETGIYGILIPPDLKGYIIVESEGLHSVQKIVKGVKHVRGRVAGSVTYEEVERLVRVRSPLEELKPGDVVEVVAGPFKGLKATVRTVNISKNEVEVEILEAAYPLKVFLPGDNIKPVSKR
ncbi:MAG: transcription elongation factor Spt5 [Sulfolobales archaeon]|nr:transcription elongation factor Spt5 [Sulfolobales archaeon]MDW8082296.1 transcription elongation factor Spt5 [Sulfolobales archaeon]